MKPNFKNIDIYAGFQPQNGMEWQKENGITADWKTPEHINVKPVYTKEDLEGMEHLNYVAGIPPYLRGPYSMMYTSVLGLSASTQVSPLPKKATHSIAVIWHQVRKACLSHSTFRHTAAMTPTMNV